MNNIQDLLKAYQQEEEPMMSTMAPADYEKIQSPVTNDMMFTEPQASDIPAIQQQPQTPIVAQAEATQPQAPETPEKPESELDRLERMLQEARRSDRALKVGGAIGDALATVINARSQMNVKAPGVQVQQGAGLGKVADMFATAPEIQSDLASRREAMLKQYAELAKGERAKLDRELKERQISAYEAQTRAQARKAELDTAKEVKEKAEKPTIGEQTVDREFAKKYNEWRTGGRADYEENKKIFDEAISALEKGDVSTGTISGIGAKIPGIRTETKQLETRVRKALNSMLRATLGAQFTQDEGERIFQQTFDPAASPEENIKNMQTELNKIEKRARDIEQQGQYFSKQKTLSGFEPQEMSTNTQRQLSPKDQQALDWANSNPNDPRAEQIKRKLGM